MVRIRLQRFGKKKSPFYRIVCADSRSPRDGRFIEIIGHWDPKRKIFDINKERYIYWIQRGAQPTDIVESLVRNFKVFEKESSQSQS
ncbi:30S ribosomal protein S16 [bacterium HR19]|nr:30S ribosomal protein S16 [bacterium HR19]